MPEQIGTKIVFLKTLYQWYNVPIQLILEDETTDIVCETCGCNKLGRKYCEMIEKLKIHNLLLDDFKTECCFCRVRKLSDEY